MRLTFFFSSWLFVFFYCSSSNMLLAQWTETGGASYYADKFHGRFTASGEKYDKHDFSAAHRTLPIGSVVRVYRLGTDQSVEVRINDCGPHKSDRIIDLSRAAAKQINLLQDGIAEVRVELIRPGDGHCACDRNKKWDASEWQTPELQPLSSEPITANASEDIPTEVDSEPEAKIRTLPSPPDTQQMPTNENVQGIVIQAGAFGTEENAAKLVQRIKDQDIGNTFVKSFNQGGKTIFRVYLGTFSSKEEALNAQAALKEKLGIDGLVVELKP